MSTVESLHAQKIRAFKQQKEELLMRARKGEDISDMLKNVEAQETDYLLNAYGILKDYFSSEDTPGQKNAGKKAATKNNILEFVTVEATSQKGNLFKQYMATIEKDEKYMAKMAADAYDAQEDTDIDACVECNTELITANEERVCPHCARCYPLFSFTINNLSFEQRIHDVQPVYSYKRQNHFMEWLQKIQAAERTIIPQDIIDAVKLELKQARVTDPRDIDQKKVKFYLKKLKLSKYFDHVAHITTVLTGKSAPKFSNALIDQLKNMFEEIQQPFDMFCPKTRKNFLSYAYVLRKFFELLGEDHYIEYLPCLKSNLKLYQQDQIWKQICEHLKWEFIPSV